MKLELFTLCDFAKGEPSGKLYVIGAFDRMFSPTEPIPMPPAAIAARLRFDEIERGMHSFLVSFVDSDGAKVIPDIGSPMNIQIPPGEATITVNVVVGLPALTLKQFGEYSLDLAVDSRVEASIPLYVRKPPAPALR